MRVYHIHWYMHDTIYMKCSISLPFTFWSGNGDYLGFTLLLYIPLKCQLSIFYTKALHPPKMTMTSSIDLFLTFKGISWYKTPENKWISAVYHGPWWTVFRLARHFYVAQEKSQFWGNEDRLSPNFLPGSMIISIDIRSLVGSFFVK